MIHFLSFAIFLFAFLLPKILDIPAPRSYGVTALIDIIYILGYIAGMIRQELIMRKNDASK